MFEAYKIGIRLTLINHVSRGLAMMTKDFAVAGIAAKELQARIDKVKMQMTTGAMTFGAGAMLAAPLIFAIDKAAELQKQMIGVRLATAGTTIEMDKMRGVIEQTAATTVFSNIDVAKMAKILGTSMSPAPGASAAQQVTGLLPAYAKFADVQYLMKGTSYTQSVTEAIRLAHTAGKYDPASLSKYLDLLTKVSLLVPGGLGEVGHALKYSQGIAKKAFGVEDEQMVLLAALLNRMGFAGSRGGTNLIAAMTRTIPGVFGSGLLAGKSGQALANMGFVDAQGHSRFLKSGKFDTLLWVQQLSQYVARELAQNPEGIARQNIMKNFQHAFGAQGARVVSLLADPQALTQLSLMATKFNELASTGAMQSTFADESVAQKYMNAKTNFVSAMTELGYTLLPLATKWLTSLNNGLSSLILWLTENQKQARLFMSALVGLAAGLMIRGAIIMLTAAFKGLGLVIDINSGAAGAASVTAATTSLGRFGLMIQKVGRVAMAFGGGYIIGSEIYDSMSDHRQNVIGRNIAGFLGAMGNKEAEAMWQREHAALTGGGSYYDVTQANKTRAVIQNHLHINGRAFAKIVTEHQSDGLFGPQRGSSIFDISMMPPTVGMPITGTP